MWRATYPFSGHLFLFRSKRADYLKILYYDGTGLCLFAKRLENGKFLWPPLVDGSMTMSAAQLALLLIARVQLLVQLARRDWVNSFFFALYVAGCGYALYKFIGWRAVAEDLLIALPLPPALLRRLLWDRLSVQKWRP